MKFDAAREKMARALKQDKGLRHTYISNMSMFIYNDQHPGMGYITIEHPLDWWQAFKHRFSKCSFPAWQLYLKKYPVEFKRHIIKPYDSYKGSGNTEPPENLSTLKNCRNFADRILDLIFDGELKQ